MLSLLPFLFKKWLVWLSFWIRFLAASKLLTPENYQTFPIFRIICVLKHSSKVLTSIPNKICMSTTKHLLVLKGWSSSLKAHQKELGVVSHPNVSISRVKWVRVLQHFYEKNTIVFVSQEVEINSEETFIYALAFPHDIS